MSGTYSTLYAENGWVVMHATQDGLYWVPVSKPQATQAQAEALADILREQAGQPKKTAPAKDWVACTRASNRLADLVCAMYHSKDAQARKTFPTATWAEIIASELGIEVPDND